MDLLQQLVEKLCVLARTNEPNRVALVEKAIDEYLNDKAGIVRLSLERLCNAIEREEADRRALEDWSIAKDYIRSRFIGWPSRWGAGRGLRTLICLWLSGLHAKQGMLPLLAHEVRPCLVCGEAVLEAGR